MKKRIMLITILLVAALTLCGCMRTVDQMYRVPKRSDQFTELQAAIDGAMTDFVYCAPVAGENQQAVQMADLNGDGVDEFLIFAKGDAEYPLRVLIFRRKENSFELVQTIESAGAAFDMVEYSDMDTEPGVELIFGSQLTDQLMRNVCVYAFSDSLDTKLLVSANYTKFLCTELDGKTGSELFVVKPGSAEADNGIAEVYRIKDGKTESSNEVNMSGPAGKLKRILVGKIQGGIPAVYIATTVDDNALITDVYVCDDGSLVNVTASNEHGTSVKTMRNYYVFADDIDGDGVIELPYLMPMMPMDNMANGNRQELIRWYSITYDGEEIIKAYSFHDYIDGWYMNLDSDWAARLTVLDLTDTYEFYVWDPEYVNAEKVLTIFTKSGQMRNPSNENDGNITLLDDKNVMFTAKLEECAAKYGLTPEQVCGSFHLINQAWKTGET